jgi:alpha-1,6-mannosyltransferase
MRIVDVAEFYSEAGGGVRTYIEQKLACAADLGVDVTIVAPGEADWIERRGAGRVVWVKSPPMPFDPNYRRFAFSGSKSAVHEVLDDLRPHVVEASSTWCGGWIVQRWQGAALKSLFLHQDPVAVYPHALLDRKLPPERIDRAFGFFWKYLDRLSRPFDIGVVSGAWLADKLARLGLRPFVSVPLGVEKSPFASAVRDAELRRSMLRACGVDPDADGAVLAVAVSRHHPEKRIPTLIAAVRRLGAERPFGLYLLGDGPGRARVEQLAARTPGVHVAGVERDRDRLAAYLASSDLFLHGGAAETFGLALAEAMTARLPLVAPDAGGAGELMGAAWGESYRAGDPDACAAAVRRLLARDRAGLSRAAGAAARSIPTPTDHFANLFGCYEQALTAAGRAPAQRRRHVGGADRAPLGVAGFTG